MIRFTSSSSSTASSITWSRRAAALGEQHLERFGLVPGARKAVEDRALLGRGVEPLADQRADDGVADQLAALHHRLGLQADRRAGGDASRSMSPVDSWIMPRAACSRAACVPLPAPGGPRRMMFIIAALSPVRRSRYRRRGVVLSFAFLIRSPYWWAIRWLWIWLTVSIVTLTTISRLVPPRWKLRPGLGREDLGNQADEHEIGRADHGDAVEQIIEILLGRLARPDAGDEAAVALQILGRLLAVELHRGVEEAEEGDAERRRAPCKAARRAAGRC